ncbi:MAG: flagellar basal body rod protein FlgB [Lawsonibacter sp.]|nr:flagellar basal body rod protein FlgB [Lawsonibacter sp.]
MDFLSCNSQVMLEKSMGFLWTKQAAILDNIANAETPEYKEKIVTFEESLRQQLEQVQTPSGQGVRRAVAQVLDQAEVQVTVPNEAKRMDDNSVDTTEQMVEAVRNSYQLQYVMQSISTELAVLRSAIRGQ